MAKQHVPNKLTPAQATAFRAELGKMAAAYAADEAAMTRAFCDAEERATRAYAAQHTEDTDPALADDDEQTLIGRWFG